MEADDATLTASADAMPPMLVEMIGSTIANIVALLAEVKAIEAAAKKKAADTVKEATAAEKKDVDALSSFHLAAEVKAIDAATKKAIAALTKEAETLALLLCCSILTKKAEASTEASALQSCGAKLEVTMNTATSEQKGTIGRMKALLIQLAKQDTAPLTIPELRDLTLFFCGEKALAAFDVKLDQWAFDAKKITTTVDGKEYTMYLTLEHIDHTVLPTCHEDCFNLNAIVVHFRMDIYGKVYFVKVYQQDHARRLEDLREKSELELKSLHATGVVKLWTAYKKGVERTRVEVLFTKDDAEKLQRLSEALAAEALPMAIGTPVRLQWKMSHQAESKIPKNHRAYIQTLQSSALLTLAMEMMDSPDSKIREKSEALKLKVQMLKGDPKLYTELLKKCNEDTDAGVEISQITLQKVDIAKPKSVTGAMLLEHLTGVVSRDVSALMCEAMAVMADMLIADKLAAEEAAALAAAEKRAAKLAAAKLAAEQAAALVATEQAVATAEE